MPDMIAARQELDLRPQLERLDRLICWSEDIDEGALSFAFRPLWQLDEPARAALALSRAQATQVYAGLKLWPDAVMARLAEAQIIADGTYPNAAAVFAENGATGPANTGGTQTTLDFSPTQPRDLWGRWAVAGGGAPSQNLPIVRVAHVNQSAGDNPDIEQNLTEEQREQKERSGFAHHPDPDDPIDELRAAIYPLGTAGGGGKVEIPTPAVTTASPSVPLVKSSPVASSEAQTAFSPAGEAEADLAALSRFWKPAAVKTPEEIAAHPLMRAIKALLEGDVETAEACKAELPPEIQKHLIPGIIGPGPNAKEPIPLAPGQKITEEMKNRKLSDGSEPQCHACAPDTANETGRRLSLDHQPSTKLNILGWSQCLYRHCKFHYCSQGGHVQVIMTYMQSEGLIP